MSLSEDEGRKIAEQIGEIRYDGEQEGIGHQFTDLVTGTTFYGNTLEEVKRKLAEKRELFAKTEVEKPQVKPSYSRTFWTREPSNNRIEILRKLGLDIEPYWAQPWDKLTPKYKEAIATYYSEKPSYLKEAGEVEKPVVPESIAFEKRLEHELKKAGFTADPGSEVKELVTVICPICKEPVVIPQYDAVTRSDALTKHIQEEHTGYRAGQKGGNPMNEEEINEIAQAAASKVVISERCKKIGVKLLSSREILQDALDLTSHARLPEDIVSSGFAKDMVNQAIELSRDVELTGGEAKRLEVDLALAIQWIDKADYDSAIRHILDARGILLDLMFQEVVTCECGEAKAIEEKLGKEALRKILASEESNPGEYVTIVDPGKTTFIEGQIVSCEAFEKENERVKKLGEKPATERYSTIAKEPVQGPEHPQVRVQFWDGTVQRVKDREEAVEVIKEGLKGWVQEGDRIIWYNTPKDDELGRKPSFAVVVNEVGEDTDASARILYG